MTSSMLRPDPPQSRLSRSYATHRPIFSPTCSDDNGEERSVSQRTESEARRTLTSVSSCTPSAFPRPSEFRSKSSSHSTLPDGKTTIMVLPPYAVQASSRQHVKSCRRKRRETARRTEVTQLFPSLNLPSLFLRLPNRSDEQSPNLDISNRDRLVRVRIDGVKGCNCRRAERGRAGEREIKEREESEEMRTVPLVGGKDVEVLVSYDHRVDSLRVETVSSSSPRRKTRGREGKEAYIVGARDVLCLPYHASDRRMEAVVVCWCEAEDGNCTVLQGRSESRIVEKGAKAEVLSLQRQRRPSPVGELKSGREGEEEEEGEGKKKTHLYP